MTKHRNFALALAAVAVLLVILVATSLAAPSFTGDAAADFTGPDVLVQVDGTGPNVSIDAAAPPGTVSGWDIRQVFFEYDASADIMYVGIDCWVICGDADGNGDPGTALVGVDSPNLGAYESISLLLDPVGGPPDFEYVVGVATFADLSSFGLYEFDHASQFSPGFGYRQFISSLTPFGAAIGTPDLEFAIPGFSGLMGFVPGSAFTLRARAFAGSIADVGFGEDAVDISLDFTTTVTNPGTGTPGYWKTHPEAWPVQEITIGGVTYARDEAINWMNLPEKGDKSLTLFRALVSAKLNVIIGNDPSCVANTISMADAWMGTYPAGSGVKGGGPTSPWREGEPLYLTLDDYNNGLLCAPHRD
jgi:hypothetical protein